MDAQYDNWWLENSNGDQEMEDSHQHGWENVLSLIDEKDIFGLDILDFGCNQGKFLRVLFDKVPFDSAYGIDIAKMAIETAKQRVGDYPIHYDATDDSWALAIPTSSKSKDAAKTFSAWATSKAYGELVAEKDGVANVPPGTRASTYSDAYISTCG